MAFSRVGSFAKATSETTREGAPSGSEAYGCDVFRRVIRSDGGGERKKPDGVQPAWQKSPAELGTPWSGVWQLSQQAANEVLAQT